MRSRLFLFAFVVMTLCACSDDDNNANDPEDSNSSMTINLPDMSNVILDNISGTAGSNYEAGSTEFAQIIATNNSNTTVNLQMFDNVDDPGTRAIQAGNSLNIDATGMAGFYATLSASLPDGSTFQATSGTVSITAYGLLNPSSNIIVTSGSFSASDGTDTISGTFTEAMLDCSECGG
ncbi:hypothetical protein [Winogradskyella sp.]|uniref:hypothetical protein n=1 Tax=Winogradskyella sp. TaxID=1883156 RepID=UPI00261A3FF8|nr:hypothetical protein [Winogradskyella sp.]